MGTVASSTHPTWAIRMSRPSRCRLGRYPALARAARHHRKIIETRMVT